MAASQQPLISNDYAMEGQPHPPPVNQNTVVIVPADSQCPGANAAPYQPSSDRVVIVTNQPPPVYRRVNTYLVDDNPTRLYIFAILSLFIPIIGIVTILMYALCAPHTLRGRKRSAFILLCIFTMIGIFMWPYYFGAY